MNTDEKPRPGSSQWLVQQINDKWICLAQQCVQNKHELVIYTRVTWKQEILAAYDIERQRYEHINKAAGWLRILSPAAMHSLVLYAANWCDKMDEDIKNDQVVDLRPLLNTDIQIS